MLRERREIKPMTDPAILLLVNFVIFAVGMFFGVSWIARRNERSQN